MSIDFKVQSLLDKIWNILNNSIQYIEKDYCLNFENQLPKGKKQQTIRY